MDDLGFRMELVSLVNKSHEAGVTFPQIIGELEMLKGRLLFEMVRFCEEQEAKEET